MPRKSAAVIALEERLQQERNYNMLLSKFAKALVQKKAERVAVIIERGEAWQLWSFPNNPRHGTVGLILLTEDGTPTMYAADVFDSTFQWPEWAQNAVNKFYREFYAKWQAKREAKACS